MEKSSTRFPLRFFMLYMLFYSGQAIYNTYINLYLDGIGWGTAQIGMAVSISTTFVLVAQILWGIASDRAKTKNTVLLLLYAASSGIALLFYANTGFGFVLVVMTLFCIFFNPIVPLQDNYMLEALEGGRWDYGQVRIGGTIGYCVTVLFIGFVLQNEYRRIFVMVSAVVAICFVMAAGLPKVAGHRGKAKKTPYREILKNKRLLGMVAFNLAFSMGLNFYYSFYPIYFTSLGGDSSKVGLLMFACAVAEIPALLLINRVVKKIGLAGTLVLAGAATSIRWFLLYVLRDPGLIIAANLLHGIGYTGFSYCIITYINATVPKDLCATTQTVNALIGNVVSRVIFGYVGGVASEIVGIHSMMLVSGAVMTLATLGFVYWAFIKKGFRQEETNPA